MEKILSFIRNNGRTALVALLATIGIILLGGETDNMVVFGLIKLLGFALIAVAYAVAKSGEPKPQE